MATDPVCGMAVKREETPRDEFTASPARFLDRQQHPFETTEEGRMHGYTSNKGELETRLSRIEGQVRGLQ